MFLYAGLKQTQILLSLVHIIIDFNYVTQHPFL